MGCHTWFYKKVNRTYEEAKEIWINNQKEIIKRWKEIINNPEDKSRIVYEWTKEFCENYLEVLNRQLKIVQKELCKVAVMNHQPNDKNGKLYQYISNNLYCTSDELPHDYFRIGNYPEDLLFSLEQTLNFLESNNDKIFYSWKSKEETIKYLKEFWNQYPNGLIKFG